MLRVVRDVLSRIEQLEQLLGDERDEVQKLGLVSLVLELISIREGGRLGAVRDELQDAQDHARPARITPEGLTYVQRSERLVSEADKRLTKAGKALSGPAPDGNLFRVQGLAASSSGVSLDAILWAPVVLFGVLAVGLVVYAIVAPEGKREAYGHA
jgi:hypothetical protein